MHCFTSNVFITRETSKFQNWSLFNSHRYIYILWGGYTISSSLHIAMIQSLRSQKLKYQLNLSNKWRSFLIILYSKVLNKTNNENKNSQCRQQKYQKRKYPCPGGIGFLWFVLARVCRDGSLCIVFCVPTQR